MKTRMIQIAIPFIWFGAVGAISFMEAPLKFTAPGINLKLGLGIGYIVFHMLNRIEIVLCIALGITYLMAKPKGALSKSAFWIIVIILLAQTFLMYPSLDARTAQVIAGTAEPYSNLHIYYIVSDAIKLIALLIFGFSTMKSTMRHIQTDQLDIKNDVNESEA